MRMFICTFPHMRTLKFFCAAFAIVATGLPTSAQNVRTNSSGAQAELHIRVIVAPVIFPPRHDKRKDRDDGGVSYDLTQEQHLSITEEVRQMLVNVDGKAADQQPVQLTTIVAK
jgi:hypothetical protein